MKVEAKKKLFWFDVEQIKSLVKSSSKALKVREKSWGIAKEYWISKDCEKNYKNWN